VNTVDSAVTTALDTVVDRLAIAETVARLAASQDTHDWAGLRSVLDDRVHFDLSAHLGVPAGELDAEEFVDHARGVAGGFTATHHSTSNFVIVGLDAGKATCRAHVVAYHHLAAAPDPDDAVCIMRGIWELSLRKDGANWVIERFIVTRTAPLEGNADLFIRTATGTSTTPPPPSSAPLS
jgi:hypothetical protein